MPTYTMAPQIGDEPPEAEDEFTVEGQNAAAAIQAARDAIIRAAESVGRASVSVGAGSGEEVEWLGAWDCEDGGEPVWSPAD